jgi:pyruvate/2-oxoglutarate dehydrogenase complex dihydrolipoamide acyltransferase (E2) component
MSIELTMPRLAMSMTEGTFAGWLVEDGAQVSAGQPIYSVEADKANEEVEAPATGTLRQTAVAGEVYEVGARLGEIV